MEKNEVDAVKQDVPLKAEDVSEIDKLMLKNAWLEQALMSNAAVALEKDAQRFEALAIATKLQLEKQLVKVKDQEAKVQAKIKELMVKYAIPADLTIDPTTGNVVPKTR